MKNKNAVMVAALFGLLTLNGCKTPPEVKAALTSLDDGYASNIKLMQQYQQLADNFKQRQMKWNLYVKNRHTLDLALLWATTDAQSPKGPQLQAGYVEQARQELGEDIVSWVNQFRLAGLNVQSGTNSAEVIFKAGTSNMGALIGAIPALAHAVAKQSATEQADLKSRSAAFDDYAARVAALRRINFAIATDLNIDVTIKPEDVRNIAGSVRTLSGN